MPTPELQKTLGFRFASRLPTVASMSRNLFPAVMIGTALLLTGCAAGTSDVSLETSTSYPDSGGFVGEADRSASEAGKGGQFSTADDLALEEALTPAADRSIIVTGWVTLTVDDPAASADEVAALAASVGGRIDSRTQDAGDDRSPATASLTIRVPVDAVTEVTDALGELGDIEQIQISESDVTSTVVDLDARIDSLRGSVDRLIALMADADDTSDLITIEDALSYRQAELESLIAQRTAIGDQVALSTITIELWADGIAPVDEPGDFLSGLATGWEALIAFGSGFLVLLGVLLPWLVVLGLVGLAVFVLLRRRRRGGTARAHAGVVGNAGETSGE